MAHRETKKCAHYRVFAMYRAEKNTAEKLAVTREVTTWKLRVNATIQRVH